MNMNIKVVIKFKASDGSEWATEEEAEARENAIEAVKDLCSLLKPIDHLDGNGGNYVQHDPAAVKEFKHRLVMMASKACKVPAWAENWERVEALSSVGRYLNGGTGTIIPVIYQAWWRLMKIDSAGREWGQPYYANHPNYEAKALP